MLFFFFTFAALAFADSKLDQALVETIYRDGKTQEIEKLLDLGASPNAIYPLPNTNREILIPALYAAVQRGNLETIDLLLERGAHPNIGLSNKYGKESIDYPLHVVARSAPLECRTGGLHSVTYYGYHYEGNAANRAVIYLHLLKKGASQDARAQIEQMYCKNIFSSDYKGKRTPLAWAVMTQLLSPFKNPEQLKSDALLVKTLIASKVLSLDELDHLLFELPTVKNAGPILASFFENGYSPNIKHENAWPHVSLLSTAVESRQIENAAYLLSLGVNPNEACLIRYAVHYAGSFEGVEKEKADALLNLLLEKGASLETADLDCGLQAIFNASATGNTNLMNMLIAKEPRLKTLGAKIIATCLNHGFKNCSAKALIDFFTPASNELNAEMTYFTDKYGSFYYATDWSNHPGPILTHALRLPCSNVSEHLESLLALGADATATWSKGGWPRYNYLNYASDQGCGAEVFKSLIKKGASVKVKGLDEMTPLVYEIAMGKGRLDIIEILINAGANMDVKWIHPETKMTLIHHAVDRNSTELIALLLSAGAPLNVSANKIGTPIEYSVCRGAGAPLIEKLAGFGALPVAGLLSQFIKCKRDLKDVSTVRSLLKVGANPHLDKKIFNGWNLLHFASLHSAIEIIPELKALGIDINFKTTYSETPLLIAIKKYPLAVSLISALVSNGATPDNDQLGSLYSLVDSHNQSKEFLPVAKILIDAGALINGYQIIKIISEYHKLVELLPLLKEKGVKFDDSPYVAGVIAGEDLASFKLLDHYQVKMDIASPGTGGSTPIFFALEARNDYFLERLLELKVNTNHQNLNKMSPLHHLLKLRDPAVKRIRALLKAGASVNAVSGEGETPLLSVMVRNLPIETLKVLVESGADVNAKLPDGRTAIQIALKSGKTNVVVYLCSKGGNDPVCSIDKFRGTI